MTGSARVARAAPDGYQFVLGTVGTHAQGALVPECRLLTQSGHRPGLSKRTSV
jgi:hypothetical protein